MKTYFNCIIDDLHLEQVSINSKTLTKEQIQLDSSCSHSISQTNHNTVVCVNARMIGAVIVDNLWIRTDNMGKIDIILSVYLNGINYRFLASYMLGTRVLLKIYDKPYDKAQSFNTMSVTEISALFTDSIANCIFYCEFTNILNSI